ncbi:prepilin peptidase, partial [bacterium]|nr:prepilin peptidase [bacterium]
MVATPIGLLPWWMVYLPVVILGLGLGSFANVLIYRLPRGESIVRPPSRCPQCQTPIRPWDNVPVLSWLVLGGRCRGCAHPISIRYPLVEMASCTFSVLSFMICGINYAGCAYSLLFIALLTLVIIDLEHWILPFAITLPLTIIGLGGAIFYDMRPLGDSLLGMAVGFGIFWCIGPLGNAIFRLKERAKKGERAVFEEEEQQNLRIPNAIAIAIMILIVALAFWFRLAAHPKRLLVIAIFAVLFASIWFLGRFIFRSRTDASEAAGAAFGQASRETAEDLKTAGAVGGGDMVFGLMAGSFLG